MSDEVDVMILGAGVAGLGAALRARELEVEAVVFEANKSAGGLLDNFEIEGFRFDNAVHLSFATEDRVRKIFDATPYFAHSPDAKNFETDKWLKHPVQNNLYPLSAEEKVDLIESLINRPENSDVEDYEQWLRHQYGDAIAERFPIKYTRKYWQTDAANLSTNWIGNRVRRAELKEILYGAFTNETPNTYYAKEMRYPKKGGYKAFIQGMIDDSDIKYECKATAIDLENKVVVFNNQTRVRYKKLVSSLPLPIFVQLCEDAPRSVVDAAKQLEATSIDLISVGFNKNIIKDLWFYIYDEDIYASRAYSPSVKSPDNVPSGCSSLQFEIYNPARASQYSQEELKENVVMALERLGIASKDEVRFLHHKHLPWGNVVFKHGMEIQREIVRSYLSLNAVSSCGRFGEWDYLWSNQSLLSGYSSLDDM